MLSGGVVVSPNDLARGVDALRSGAEGARGQGIVNGAVETVEVKEAVRAAAGVLIGPDDLARGIDALCEGQGCRAKVNSGVSAAAQEEAVGRGADEVGADDLACIVDAKGLGAKRGQGIVEGGVDAVAEEEAVLLKSAVFEKEPHDLARVVDAKGLRIVPAGTSSVVKLPSTSSRKP